MAKLTALDLIAREPWCITPEGLAQLVAIAEGLGENPEALATRLGRPLANTRTVEQHGDTAVIPITGPIFRYANLFTEISGATSLAVLARDFQAALDAPDIARIVLAIDSPGGQATGIADFAALIHAAEKPVIAHVGDLAGSAAYWLASAAAHIVVSPTALLGSIGVVATYRPDPDKPVEIVSSQSPMKCAAPDTEAGRAEAQRIVDALAAVFVADVAAGRKVPEERVLADFGRGSLLVGAAAVAAGMADAVGRLDLILAGVPGAPHGVHSMTIDTATPQAPAIDRAYLAAHHPDLVAQLLEEGAVAGRFDGAAAERARIAAVREQLIPGHEALIERLAFDGHTTGPEAAVAVLAAERGLLVHQRAIIQAAAAPVASAERPPVKPEETYEELVAAAEAAGKSKAHAMMSVAKAHPLLHRAWLARINSHSAAQ